jgi:hypothetical protein
LASWDDGPKGVNFTRAVVDVYRNGIYLGQLHPRRDYYYDSQQAMTIPGERATLRDDLYILLIDWEPASMTGATFKASSILWSTGCGSEVLSSWLESSLLPGPKKKWNVLLFP